MSDMVGCEMHLHSVFTKGTFREAMMLALLTVMSMVGTSDQGRILGAAAEQLGRLAGLRDRVCGAGSPR
jgi:hypothetical protein